MGSACSSPLSMASCRRAIHRKSAGSNEDSNEGGKVLIRFAKDIFEPTVVCHMEATERPCLAAALGGGRPACPQRIEASVGLPIRQPCVAISDLRSWLG